MRLGLLDPAISNMADYWEWVAATEKQRREVNNADSCASAA